MLVPDVAALLAAAALFAAPSPQPSPPLRGGEGDPWLSRPTPLREGRAVPPAEAGGASPPLRGGEGDPWLSRPTPLRQGRAEPAEAGGASPPLRGGEGVQRAADWKVPLAHAGGVLLGMRLAVSVAWPEAYDPTRFASERDQLRLAYTRPPEYRRDRPLLESDGDPWWVNGVGHAAFGSEIYGRTRQCGGGPVAALLAAAATSVAWEYGLEAPHKRPSAVDLVWTPLAGAIVGEGRYRLHRWLRARNASAWLLFAVDPLGESERRVLRTRC